MQENGYAGVIQECRVRSKKIKNKINNSLQLLKFLAKDTITLLEDECYQPAVSSQAGKI